MTSRWRRWLPGCTALALCAWASTSLAQVPGLPGASSPAPGGRGHRLALKGKQPPETKLTRRASPNAVANKRGRKFTMDELRDPRTKQPIGADQDVTLTFKHGKGPVKMKGRQLLDEVNKLEAQLNAQGYSLREKPTGPLVETRLDAAQLRRKEQAALAPAGAKPVRLLKNGRQQVQPTDFDHRSPAVNTAFGAAQQGQVAHSQALPQTQKAIADAKASQAQPRPLPSTLHDHWQADFGDHDILAATLQANTNVNGDWQQLHNHVDAKATITLVGYDIDLLRVQGDLASTPGGQQANLSVTYANTRDTPNGVYLVPPTNLSNPSAIAKEDDQGYTFDYGYDFYFSIGPVPMHATVGGTGSAGVRHKVAVSPLYTQVLAVPYVDAQAYARCGVDLVIAEGGVGGTLTLLKENLELASKVEVANDANNHPEYRWDYHATNTLNVLSGELFAYVTVNYFVDEWEGRWTIFKWDGITWQADLYRVQDRAPVFGVGAIATTPHASATVPASASGPTTGSGPLNCPTGQFGTTGKFHNCACPQGSKKEYTDLVKYNAICKGMTNPCPEGKFSTTSNHRGCACPAGTKKHYYGLFDQEARCK
jgi:hypothetical protein